MKKIFLLIFLIVGLAINLTALAHPGNTDTYGGHYCWTNCAGWGETYSAYHFHDVSYASCASWISTATQDKKRLDLLMLSTIMGLFRVHENVSASPFFNGASFEAQMGAIKSETQGLASLQDTVKRALDRWKGMEAACMPYYEKNAQGTFILKSFNPQLFQTSILTAPSVEANLISPPSNFTTQKTSNSIIIRWKQSPSLAYEYILDPELYRVKEQLDADTRWKKIKTHSIKFKTSQAIKGRLFYLYIRAKDKDGNRSSIQSINVQF